MGMFVLAAASCSASPMTAGAGTSTGGTSSTSEASSTTTGSTTIVPSTDGGLGSDTTAANGPGACGDSEFGDVPMPAAGCSHVFLRDELQETDMPSGFVVCGPQPVYYRIAAVQCSGHPDSECLCDADCGDDRICACAELPGYGVNRCLPADCRTSDECVDGHCKVVDDICFVPSSLRCTTPSDDCVAHGDCVRTNFCAYDSAQELFTCEPGGICE